MRIAVGVRSDGGAALLPLADDGTPVGAVEWVDDLAAAVAERERLGPRWVWSASRVVYPPLLAAGVRVGRCHDVELTESLLLGHAGRYGEPRSVRAAWARSRDEPVPADEPLEDAGRQPSLFDESGPGEDVEMIAAVHAGQLARIAAGSAGLSLLAAAESAGGLIAAEMGHDGLPWRADLHDALYTELLGPRPSLGMRPRKLQALADQVAEAFGHVVNPDSPAQVVKAFKDAGFPVPSTRAHVLKQIDHPAVPIVLEYKELARLWTAHGWTWLDAWVHDGRFRPEYVVGGVVSGRWATRGGGALQIPKVLRRAAVADPGWKLVVADAAQLEPRVLAALAGDRAFAAAAAQGDLYAALAHAFETAGTTRTASGVAAAKDGPSARDKAKIALLSAMYGGGTGEGVQLLGVLRSRFPEAYEYVENAAREGERGRLVRSRLGRTCPPPSAAWREVAGQESGGGAARSRGRFTRNFVVQATAADWALVLLASLRRRLASLSGAYGSEGAHLVFFQHDEVVVHTPEKQAEAVATAIRESAEEAGHLMFGRTPVVFPMHIATVDCYADAK